MLRGCHKQLRAGRFCECGCVAFGAAVGARSARVCGHTTVTESQIRASQIGLPTEIPQLCHAAATSSCARGRTRECGCLPCGAEVVARSAHLCDHTFVAQTLILAFQGWKLLELPYFCRAAATSNNMTVVPQLAMRRTSCAWAAHAICDDGHTVTCDASAILSVQRERKLRRHS